MAKITVMPYGIKGGLAAGMNRTPAKRGNAKGWTAAAARRNRDFLKSIDATRLTGTAIAATLTLGRAIPITPDGMRQMRETFFKRLRREGVIRHHWVLEFQRDGTPHLHMMIFGQPGRHELELAYSIEDHWCAVTAPTGTRRSGQMIVSMEGITGWLKYLAKHGARSAEHYQRGELPAGWEEPGRMWGKMGEWPALSQALELDPGSFYRIRRWLRNWRQADAQRALWRAQQFRDLKGDEIARRRIRSAKRLLRRNDRQRAATIGFDEWADPQITRRMLALLAVQPGAIIRDWDLREIAPQSPPDPLLSHGAVGAGGRSARSNGDDHA